MVVSHWVEHRHGLGVNIKARAQIVSLWTHSPQLRHHRAALFEDVCAIFLVDEVGEVVLQRFFITALFLILEDLDNNGRVAIAVEVNFLMVGHFSDLAMLTCQLVRALICGMQRDLDEI